jgi:hypothetical protein
MNTLHGMPSLLHLSSTQSELENSNVHYSAFDIDLSTPASADDQSINNDNPITDPLIEKCLSDCNTICLLPDIAFQVHLLSQMKCLTCLIKSLDASRHMRSITKLITQHCKYCQESN